jgi:hypothetical protein
MFSFTVNLYVFLGTHTIPLRLKLIGLKFKLLFKIEFLFGEKRLVLVYYNVAFFSFALIMVLPFSVLSLLWCCPYHVAVIMLLP